MFPFRRLQRKVGALWSGAGTRVKMCPPSCTEQHRWTPVIRPSIWTFSSATCGLRVPLAPQPCKSLSAVFLGLLEPPRAFYSLSFLQNGPQILSGPFEPTRGSHVKDWPSGAFKTGNSETI